LISLSCLKASLPALSLITVAVAVLFFHIRLPVKPIIRELRFFLVLLICIFCARALFTPGSPAADLKIAAVSRAGLYDGVLVCWRLVLIVMLGLLLVSTTRPSGIKAAVEWCLKPFPFIPEKRVATMMSLIIRFVPVILDQAKETADAQRARGVENRKNPVYRLKKLLIPLIRRTFETADKLATAMEARCYSENRTDPGLSSKRTDWVALAAVLCLCILALSTYQ